ncbi:hypothetical protein ACQVTW_31185 [Bacillus mycoides]|uniref:hypothetical protein n=1 Tax=Bacillus mycoides TaxID=1405 RepID=UPI003D651C91
MFDRYFYHRPVSPHLSIYSIQVSSIMSVLHRFSAIVLTSLFVLSIFVFNVTFNFLLVGLKNYTFIHLFFYFFIYIVFGFHALNGFRYILFSLNVYNNLKLFLFLLIFIYITKIIEYV